MQFEDNIASTLMKALSDLKDTSKTPSNRPRSRLESNTSNKEVRRVRSDSDVVSRRSEKNQREVKKEGLRSKLTQWWQKKDTNNGNEDKKKMSATTKTLYKPTIMRKRDNP